MSEEIAGFEKKNSSSCDIDHKVPDNFVTRLARVDVSFITSHTVVISFTDKNNISIS